MGMSIEQMAKIIEAEASVLGFQGKLAVAQCICDNRFDPTKFTTPAENYSPESLMAAELAIEKGARRFSNAKILQFRSFKNYGKGETPDFRKIYGTGLMPDNLLYLGKDSKGENGHFYFGQYTKLKGFKLLVMAGHGRNVDGTWDPGAIGSGHQEAYLTRDFANRIVARAKENGIDCDLAPDRNHYSFFKHGGIYNVSDYNYVLEVHFNASTTVDIPGDGSMRGTMFYIDQDEKGDSVEWAILNNLLDIGSRKAWDGVVTTQIQYTSGLMVQRHVRMQGVSHAVLETCFITDADDIRWYLENRDVAATKVIEGIISGFGLITGEDNSYKYVGKGIATGVALEEMNVREQPDISKLVVGTVRKSQRVEILKHLENGWLMIVWPGLSRGYAYTSNVGGLYYEIEN